MVLEAISRRRWIYLGLVLSLLLAWALTPLPAWLAYQIVQTIPLRSDIELGRHVAVRLRSQVLQDDGALQAMGERLLRGMRSQVEFLDEYRWQFQLLNDDSVNAFACPGGFIFVNRGLRRIATDDELAAVLGHEIGHVLHRHSQQRMVQSRLGSIVLEALLVGDGDGVSEGIGGEVAGILLRGADTLLTLSYSRANEYEADAVAWWASLSAGYAPEGAASFFRKLGGDGHGSSWLSTHPATEDRIVVLESKGRELAKLRRQHRGRNLASHFAPALVDSTAAGSVVGSLMGLVPAELQKKALVAGLAGLAKLLDEVLGSVLSDSSPGSSDPSIDCEDGESKISFERVRPGYYLALGHGKCLTVDDLRGLRRSGRLDLNPYTRQPFTQAQRRRIDALLI
mmetsp:Transcript_57183/g.107520  ORF Transcript_57183/g.107520 Transcript_57183/m.107520 type:complete len:397 (-) Transcript_57183:381-1571(-)